MPPERVKRGPETAGAVGPCSVKEDHSMFRRARLAMVLAFGLVACGCSFAPPAPLGKSPLSPFQPGVQTSALEVIFVRHDYELPALTEDLWSQVEPAFPRIANPNELGPAIRRALEVVKSGEPSLIDVVTQPR